MTRHKYHGHLKYALPRVIRAEASQEYDAGFFAQLGGLEPDPETDDPTAKGLFQHLSNNTGTGWNINRSSYPGFFSRGGIIRTCIVWKNKDRTIIGHVMKTFGFLPPWRWACRKCFYTGAKPTWKLAYQSANHHAHNNH